MRRLALLLLLPLAGCPSNCGPEPGVDAGSDGGGGELDGGGDGNDGGALEDSGTPGDAGAGDDGGTRDGGIPPDAGPLPDNAWGYIDEPPPPGAEFISNEEHAALVEAGEWRPVTPHDEERAAEALAMEDAEDEAFLANYASEHPGVMLLPDDPPADDPDLVLLDSGNYLLTVTTRDGWERDFVTMGHRYWQRTVVEGRKRFATRENQEAIYREVVSNLPGSWAVELDLPDPDNLDPGLSAGEIQDLTRVVTGPDISAAILADLVFPNAPDGPPRYLDNCMEAIGASADSAELAGSLYDGSCDLDPDGIVARYDFPLRDHMTCVKDQGHRGTCTGFASTGAIEAAVSRTHDLRVNLSEQAYYNQARLHWDGVFYSLDWTLSSLDGLLAERGLRGMVDDAWLLYFEEQWPYNASPNRTETCALTEGGQCVAARFQHSCDDYEGFACSDSTHQGRLHCTDYGFVRVCGYSAPQYNPMSYGYRIFGATQIWDPTDVEFSIALTKIVLAIGKPVILGHPITTRWDLAAATDGYINYLAGDTNKGGHGSLIVGFIDNDDLATYVPTAPAGAGGGYFIVKNSWSNCSGDGGFIYVPYDSVREYTPDLTVLHGVY